MSAAAIAAVFGARAQTQTAPVPPPLAAEYSSAFEGYKPFEAGEVRDWRKSNDAVREIGGWRAYAREIQGGAAPSPQAAPERTLPGAPAADLHQGHRK